MAKPLGIDAPVVRESWLAGKRGRFVKGTAGIVALLLAWQISVPLIGLEEYFYPAPRNVWAAFLDLMLKGILPSYLVDSLERYLLGVGLGTLLGIVLGVGIGMNRFFDQLFSPLINFLFAIVEVAWLPLFVIWFGYGLTTILVALCYVVTFPVLYNTIAGMRTVPQIYVNAALSLGATRFSLLTQVLLPSALPNIITGFRTGAGFAFRGLIIAEMIAAKSGIGYLIFEGTSTQQTARTIVGMLVVGLVWLFIENVYVKPFERITVERWGLLTGLEKRQ